MISDRDAIAMAQERYAADCQRFKKRPVETVGEVAFAEGMKLAALFDSSGKLVAIYRIGDNVVSDLDGADLVRVRPKIVHRKVR
jgi:hypothetical protein